MPASYAPAALKTQAYASMMTRQRGSAQQGTSWVYACWSSREPPGEKRREALKTFVPLHSDQQCVKQSPFA